MHQNWFRINNFLETDYTTKINVKKQRRFDRLKVIFRLKDGILHALIWSIVKC